MIDSIIPPTSAVAPTPTVGGAAAPRAAPAAQVPDASAADFTAMLGQLATDASTTLRNAEAMSIAGIRGQASVQQVVNAVMAAEQTLQTAIAVRDKVVSAYLEISRMQI